MTRENIEDGPAYDSKFLNWSYIYHKAAKITTLPDDFKMLHLSESPGDNQRISLKRQNN